MTPRQALDDLPTTWGREFSAAMPADVAACGQDAWEVFRLAFPHEAFSLAALDALTEDDFVSLRDAARAVTEIETIETGHLRQAVEQTVLHWRAT